MRVIYNGTEYELLSRSNSGMWCELRSLGAAPAIKLVECKRVEEVK